MNIVTVSEKFPKIARFVTKAVFKVKKHSPEILTVVNAAGVVGTAVMASKATLRLEEEVLKPTEVDRANDETRGDKVKTVVRLSGRFVKLYAPSIIVGGVTIASGVASNRILNGRYVTAVAAYQALEQRFRESNEEIAQYVENTEDTPEEQSEVIRAQRNPYEFLFDELNPNWQKQEGLNKYFLEMNQNHANDKLRAQGHLFLNEVLDMVGIPRTQAGSITGWVWNSNTGDGFVDFGILTEGEVHNYTQREDISVRLNFNVDGVIYDQI